MYEQANRNLNTLLGVKKPTKKNTFKTTDMKTTTTYTTIFHNDTYKLNVVKFNGVGGKHTLYQIFINGRFDSSYQRLNKGLKEFFNFK